jgi:hypothetical protein
VFALSASRAWLIIIATLLLYIENNPSAVVGGSHIQYISGSQQLTVYTARRTTSGAGGRSYSLPSGSADEPDKMGNSNGTLLCRVLISF